MVLTRQEKRDLVLNLYNQGKTYREIAEEARMSPRDIGVIVNRAVEKKELEIEDKENQSQTNPTEKKLQEQELSVPTRAYKLFFKGKTLVEVAIALNLTESEATNYHKEYWKLRQLYSLYKIHEEIKDDITSLVKLHRSIRAAGMGIEQIVNLLRIANNDLPAVEQRYQKLKGGVNLLESRKFNEYRTLYHLHNRIADSKRRLKWLRLSCQEEEANVNQLQFEKIRLKRLVKHFKDNDEEYLKIKKTVQKRVSGILLDGKGLMRLAFYSLMDSMRKCPEKYNSLIYYNNRNSSNWYSRQLYSNRQTNTEHQYQLNSYDSFFESLKSTLLEDADELYEHLLKEQVNIIITNYASNRDSSLLPTSLPIYDAYGYRKKQIESLDQNKQ